jgi:hypothetical protein
LIKMELKQANRLSLLNNTAISQMKSLWNNNKFKNLAHTE